MRLIYPKLPIANPDHVIDKWPNKKVNSLAITSRSACHC